jgi:hypothetical protein
MAQATVTNIADWGTKPAASSTAMFADAFRGMETDLTELQSASNLAAFVAVAALDLEFGHNEDGERSGDLAAKQADIIVFAILELRDRVDSIWTTYQRVFEIIKEERLS